MNPEIKSLWVDALRSGKYKQCRSQLSHSGRYCCLGVLELLAFERDVIEKFDGDRPYLSPAVAEWAGLGIENTNPKLGSAADDNEHSAGWLNDNRGDFIQIADRIERYL